MLRRPFNFSRSASEVLVHFVTDDPTKVPAIRAMLEPRHHVVPQLLGGGDTQIVSNSVLMVDADLRKPVHVEQIRLVLRQLDSLSEKLFVVHNQVRSLVAQAYALGATTVVSRPREIISTLAQIEVVAKTTRGVPADTPAEVMDGAAAFASMFSAVRVGQALDLSYAERATSQVMNSIARDGLAAWLCDVRRHHEGTFQHCLLVTGFAVGFAMDLRFSEQDVRRLGMAATLHDLGKAHIPLAILDKPGSLEPDELEIVKRHPVIGFELLKNIPGISAEILEGVRHHHEYLDGSGYPDALKSPQISDLVRLLTISDIFAALVESRAYRAAMPGQDAHKILCEMGGKLEAPLVRAFRNIALVA